MRRFVPIALGIAAVSVSALGSAHGADSPVELPSPADDTDYYEDGAPAAARVELGRMLFFDKILSGNRNIACATCHHPTHATSDGLALGLGEGPEGLGPDRKSGMDEASAVHERVPRNSPALFNLGAEEFTTLFHDGRVEVDTKGYYASGFITPAKWKLPEGLDNVLAAQAMFPVGSPGEMAGQKGENAIADAVSLNNMAGTGGVWELLADRLKSVPEYVDHFRAAFPERIRSAEDITYVDAANAIAAFETVSFRSDDSPFDRYLSGSVESLGDSARRGMNLFYGKAGCSGCHAGTFQTDHDFHAIAMPQIGPGKSDGSDASYWRATGIRAFVEDFGRGRVTVRGEDMYEFRTPSLRNVELTGPWGHDGAFAQLEDVVRHHLDPIRSLEGYSVGAGTLLELDRVLELTATGSRLSQSWLGPDRLDGFLRRDRWVQEQDRLRGRIAKANDLAPVPLTDAEIGDVLAFLRSLTGESARALGELEPAWVPSGLRVAN